MVKQRSEMFLPAVFLAAFFSSNVAAALDIPIGAGVYGTLIPAHRGESRVDFSGYSPEEYGVKMKPVTGGLGVFADYRFIDLFKRAALPHSLDVGLELFFAFPRESKTWIGSLECTSCQMDVFFALNARVRFPINITPLVAPYPIFAFGVSNLTHRVETTEATNYTGIDVTLGAGVEFSPLRFCNPFLELRYLFAAGWDKNVSGSLETRTRIYYNAFLITVGIRVL